MEPKRSELHLKNVRDFEDLKQKLGEKIWKLENEIEQLRHELKTAQIFHSRNVPGFADLLMKSLSLCGDEDENDNEDSGDRYYLIADHIPNGMDPELFGFKKQSHCFKIHLHSEGEFSADDFDVCGWSASLDDIPVDDKCGEVDGIFVQAPTLEDNTALDEEMIEFLIEEGLDDNGSMVEKGDLYDEYTVFSTNMNMYLVPYTQKSRLEAKRLILAFLSTN